MSSKLTITLNEAVAPVSETFRFKQDQKVIFLNTSDVESGKILHKNFSEAQTLPGQAKKKIKTHDILFSEIRPANKRFAFVDLDDTEDYVVSTKLMVLRAKNGIFPKFVYHWMTSDRQLQEFQMLAESRSGTFPQITFDTIKHLTLNKLDYAEQVKISDFIDVIDRKIELNRKMNETLEQIGQALFKKYFIDNPERECWSDGKVCDLINIYSGFAFKRESFDADGKYGLVTIKNVQEGSFVEECTDRIENVPDNVGKFCFLKQSDILLSLTGNVGRVCYVTKNDLLLNQRVAKLRSIKPEFDSFTYFMFRNPDFKDTLISLSRGTAQMNLSPIETKNLKVKLPPDEVLSEFSFATNKIYKSLIHNSVENSVLGDLRDLLLPNLISGKISV